MLCGSNESDGPLDCSLSSGTRLTTHILCFAETKFPPRPEWDEEAAVDTSATVTSNGP